MRVARIGLAIGVAGWAASAPPASAQFFLKNPDMSGAPVRGDEPGMTMPLPGATPAELRAGLTWTLRAGLNFAALQCQFEPTLLAVRNYNAILIDHADELKTSYTTLTKYFARTSKSPKAAQSALDQFGTRIYASFSTVSAQYNFCLTAGAIGSDAVFTPRGQFATIAENRMREFRNSLKPAGEQRFGARRIDFTFTYPRFDAKCWDKRDRWNSRACGPLTRF